MQSMLLTTMLSYLEGMSGRAEGQQSLGSERGGLKPTAFWRPALETTVKLLTQRLRLLVSQMEAIIVSTS